MIKWVKPSGKEIETNGEESTIKRAVELGWEPADKKKPRKKKGD